MPIKDLIIKELEISYEGVFDIRDFLDHMKKWFKQNGYDVDEKLYTTKAKDHLKAIKIKWLAEKKVTDYDKYAITLIIDFSDIREARIDNKKVSEGRLSISFESEHEKDYEEKWRKKPTLNFLRAVYDKFVMEEKEGRLAKKLKEETYELHDEVKKYLNIK